MRTKTKTKSKRVVRIADIRTPVNFTLRDDGITQSLLSRFLCPLCGILAINGWTKPKPRTFFGARWHVAMDWLYNLKKTPSYAMIKSFCKLLEYENEETKLVDQTVLVVLLVQYYIRYVKDFEKQKTLSTEEVFDFKLLHYRQRGMVDRRFMYKKSKEQWLMEHKSMSMINESKLEDLLAIRFQNLYYLMAHPKCKGVLHNVVRNPGTRPKKNENLRDFEQRLMKDIDRRPDYYFLRWEESCSSIKEMDYFQQGVVLQLCHIDDIMKYSQTKTPPRNSLVCENQLFACDYLRACATGSLLGYVKESPFSELEG